jgi:hypothetical protein
MPFDPRSAAPARPTRATVAGPARLLVATALAVVSLLGVLPAAAPSPVAALEPPRPLPGYRPAFVTETDVRPWKDCLWASGAMFLDKWTNGRLKLTHQELRAASGDTSGGSQFRDLRKALAKYDFRLKYSPDGGDPVTWGQLLRRLEKGAGAVILGDDGDLPRWYGRWDYAFWKKKGKRDNHAVYIERYDRKRGRVWLMDPLGRGDWQGEWIPVWAIQAFAWTRGGHVFAAVTPTAKAAPFAKVKASAKPKVVLSDGALDASWKLKTPKGWRFPGAQVTARFVKAVDPLQAAAISPDVPERTGTPATTKKVTIAVDGRTMHLRAPLPTEPGAYNLRLGVHDRRFGNPVVTSKDVTVFIPGERRATLRLHVRKAGIEAGSTLRVSVNVANSGSKTWAGAWTMDAGAGSIEVERGTRAIARWVRLDAPGAVDKDAAESDAQAADAAAAADPIVLEAVPLDPGTKVVIKSSLKVPTALGRWALVVDVVDDVDGSYAALGSQPAVAVIEVVAPRGRDAVE